MKHSSEHVTYRQAPKLRVDRWIDAEGKEIDPIRLSQFEGKFKVIYCFQSWCPGCHQYGFPSLKEMVNALKGNDKVAFLAVQTVFEGEHANTWDKVFEEQKEYELNIPFGHDAYGGMSTIMKDYQTRGTPWFIFIDPENRIIFEDFHIDAMGAIGFLKEYTE